ncbi:hypothetical protein HZH68_016383 [Vespula germanica]|uniref:Uncharacterized protein n=1 Tax=Vespula germanica TaxID=30212 RepID=A0A834J1M0_VESGE|nr:hypothetical protein HZH68_016383 [Vespula germanica]
MRERAAAATAAAAAAAAAVILNAAAILLKEHLSKPCVKRLLAGNETTKDSDSENSQDCEDRDEEENEEEEEEKVPRFSMQHRLLQVCLRGRKDNTRMPVCNGAQRYVKLSRFPFSNGDRSEGLIVYHSCIMWVDTRKLCSSIVFLPYH